ncbi:TetR/AcrR family transcriptional regulator [Glycomyces tritici]|uniref:TetR/AcrR family transcriptional regulator n=1 Tax=Glycomyces tritici TaxID=2665176 RepID=A0ABT7YSV0_9ACTN|nr:TetR/AcrR family transcriptional regulator [Glycomyces tritici]MDN3241715.1 TetR/AcrR family transcriptional regulator [Glycomyces tritici]
MIARRARRCRQRSLPGATSTGYATTAAAGKTVIQFCIQIQNCISTQGGPVARRLSREESRAQTKERLLDAAEELFVSRGVNGTSVEQIAELAGFSRGAFYSNFEGRHELVLALLERRTERELREVAALGENAASFAEVIERLREFNRRRAEHLEQWFALRIELLLYALRNPEVRPLLARREYMARRAMAGGIAEILSRYGVAPPADPDFLGLIVHALEDGLLIQRLIAPEGVALQDIAPEDGAPQGIAFQDIASEGPAAEGTAPEVLASKIRASERIGDEVVVDAFELLIDSWTATAKKTEKS